MISGKTVVQVIIAGEDDEVLAVISDSEIIEKEGVSVIIDGD